MTSDFVRNIHIQTAQQMWQKGASLEKLAEHFYRVGFNEYEVTALLAEFGQLCNKSPDEEFA